MTNIQEINIIDKHKFGDDLPITVERIAKEFYGITDIQYIKNNIENKSHVFIYTKNHSTIDVLDLLSIQIKLNAKSLQIISSNNSLIYNLIY